MAYGERGFAGQKMFRAENLWRFAFVVLVWPVTGWLPILAGLGAASAIEKRRPSLNKYACYACAIALAMLITEIPSLISQPQMAIAVGIDIVLTVGLVAWLAMGYSRIAAAGLALFEAVGIVVALQAKMGAGGIGFFFEWAVVALVVVRLGVIGCAAVAVRQGLRLQPVDDIAEIFA